MVADHLHTFMPSCDGLFQEDKSTTTSPLAPSASNMRLTRTCTLIKFLAARPKNTIHSYR